MKHHWAAWDQTAREHGIALTAAELLSLAGKPSTAIMKLLCEQQGLTIDIDKAVKRKADLYCELAVTTQPIEAVMAVARAAKTQGIPIAIATGGSKRQVTGSMAAAGISTFFDAVVTCDVSRQQAVFFSFN
jgi:beta-phosphoglucomutase-like phosphatase (HAD superfamily)